MRFSALQNAIRKPEYQDLMASPHLKFWIDHSGYSVDAVLRHDPNERYKNADFVVAMPVTNKRCFLPLTAAADGCLKAKLDEVNIEIKRQEKEQEQLALISELTGRQCILDLAGFELEQYLSIRYWNNYPRSDKRLHKILEYTEKLEQELVSIRDSKQQSIKFGSYIIRRMFDRSILLEKIVDIEEMNGEILSVLTSSGEYDLEDVFVLTCEEYESGQFLILMDDDPDSLYDQPQIAGGIVLGAKKAIQQLGPEDTLAVLRDDKYAIAINIDTRKRDSCFIPKDFYLSLPECVENLVYTLRSVHRNCSNSTVQLVASELMELRKKMVWEITASEKQTWKTMTEFLVAEEKQ